MNSSPSSDACLVCSRPADLQCSRCEDVSYCSRTCQRDDHVTHKLLCASLSRFDMTNRPTENHIRAIIFPVDQKRPELIWIECERASEDLQYRSAKPFFNDTEGTTTPLEYNFVLGRPLCNVIFVAKQDDLLRDGSAPNRSIATITGTGGSRRDWRGPVIAFGMAGPNLEQLKDYRDIDLEDFRHITDYFITYDSSHGILGVRINCRGDQEVLKKPPFEEVKLTPWDPIFTDHDTSDIAERIGLPIFTKSSTPAHSWANADDSKMYENMNATYLHLCCDPEAKSDIAHGIPGWGSAPMKWQNRVGSVIVARQDQKPLSPWHVEALCRYCLYEAGAYLAHSNDAYCPDEPMSKDLVLSMICRPTFSIFWQKFHKEIHEKGGSIRDVSSPYLV
ncbi:hypothetical protein F4678DRAFT_476640 [Xylaria arbuscula]|nr:hypothetical protein F4678DRAFT_476640 [Xylaria arbuscula]